MNPDMSSPLRAMLLIALFVQCSPRSSRDTAPPPAATDRGSVLTGKVYVTGSEPLTRATLVRDEPGEIILLGGLEPELRRLSGATVLVRGRESRQGPNRTLDVENYEVLSVDGEAPAVGTLEYRDNRVLLIGRDTVELTSIPAGLRTKHGAKVWIVGQRAGNMLEVRSFGVLREASR